MFPDVFQELCLGLIELSCGIYVDLCCGQRLLMFFNVKHFKFHSVLHQSNISDVCKSRYRYALLLSSHFEHVKRSFNQRIELYFVMPDWSLNCALTVQCPQQAG